MGASLILFLSDYKKKPKEEGKPSPLYFYKEGMEYPGDQTNEAPLQCIMDRAKNIDGQEIKKIICITSKLVASNKTGPENKTALQYYEQKVKEYADKYQYGSIPEVAAVPYDFCLKEDMSEESLSAGKLDRLDPDKDLLDITEMEERARRTYFGIVHELSGTDTEKGRVYIDYTGGFRDISFLMVTIIRYLEFQGIECKQIIYSQLTDKRLYEVSYIYDMFQLINGVNEFASTGNAHLLKELYDVHPDPAIKPILESIISFADTISLCQIGKIDKAVAELSETVNNAEENLDGTQFFSQLFETLIPLIQKKMYLKELIRVVNGKKLVCYPKLIQWCMDNRMYQQAITIYTEKLPVYYKEIGLIPESICRPEDVNTNDLKNGESLEGKLFYTELFDRIAEGPDVRRLKRILEEIKLKNLESVPGSQDNKKKINETGYLKDLKKVSSENPRINDACKRITSALENQDQWRNPVYSKPVGQPSRDQFMAALSGDKDSLRYLHYYIYNAPEDYKSIPEKTKNENVTLRKKFCALKRAQIISRESEIFSDLFEAMKYYLAVKMVRNRINHASENIKTDDEKTVISDFKKNFGIIIDTDVENISAILRQSMTHLNRL